MNRDHVTLLLASSLGIALGGSVVPALAGTPANEDMVCRADLPELDKYQTLRALSLDLRGVIPSMEEYALLDGLDDIPESLLDAWLESEEFVQRAVRWHREMLWNGLSPNISFVHFRWGLTRNSQGLHFRGNSSSTRVYRGGAVAVPCADVPATFEADGTPRKENVSGDLMVEGYVMVEPYWAPGTQVKACAFDAQTTAVTSTGLDCSTLASLTSTECGCGPNLRWCRQGDEHTRLARAFTEDVDRRIAEVIRDNRPYTDLFTSHRAYVNGPLVHFLRYQTGLPQDVNYQPLAYDVATLPDIPYTDNAFYPVELKAGQAGILTSAAFLSKFQTNRGRANRFHNAFLCEPFQPPARGLPVPTAESLRELNLQKRDGCKYCHAQLEPAASHWGRFPERGAGYLEPVQFPDMDEGCQVCAATNTCSPTCNAYYYTRATAASERDYVGMLKAMYFLREDHRQFVDLGPSYLVSFGLADNRVPSCLATQVVERLSGRNVLPDERQMVREQMARQFTQSGFSYRALVKAMVTNPTYRRVR